MGTTTETSDVTAALLHGRARRLRRQAAWLPPLVAQAYRRRAAELDLQAWLEAVWNPPLDLTITVEPGGRVTRTKVTHLIPA